MIKTSSLIKQLNEASENLSEENGKVFDDIVLYIRTSNIKIRDQEEFLQQILDSFLHAEQKGISIESMLGTSDIRQYCEEIVNAYKSSYNSLSLIAEHIMYLGIFIVILSIYKFISNTFTALLLKSSGLNSLSFFLDVNLELIIQFLILVPFTFVTITLFKKSCFKKTSKVNKIKEFFIYWILCVSLISAMVAISMFVSKTVFFSLNLVIILIIGTALYFIGTYLSEK